MDIFCSVDFGLEFSAIAKILTGTKTTKIPKLQSIGSPLVKKYSFI